MDRIEDLLHRIRDPHACADLLSGARGAEARGVAGQLAAVLSALPAAHRELEHRETRGASFPGAAQGATRELVRLLGRLELVLMHLAAHPRGRLGGRAARAQLRIDLRRKAATG
jgi:hypothetical protein